MQFLYLDWYGKDNYHYKKLPHLTINHPCWKTFNSNICTCLGYFNSFPVSIREAFNVVQKLCSLTSKHLYQKWKASNANYKFCTWNYGLKLILELRKKITWSILYHKQTQICIAHKKDKTHLPFFWSHLICRTTYKKQVNGLNSTWEKIVQ